MSQADRMTADEVWPLVPTPPASPMALCEVQGWPWGLGGPEGDVPQPPRDCSIGVGGTPRVQEGGRLPQPHLSLCRVSPPPPFPASAETRQSLEFSACNLPFGRDLGDPSTLPPPPGPDAPHQTHR